MALDLDPDYGDNPVHGVSAPDPTPALSPKAAALLQRYRSIADEMYGLVIDPDLSKKEREDLLDKLAADAILFRGAVRQHGRPTQDLLSELGYSPKEGGGK